jgi:hypothetical protein
MNGAARPGQHRASPNAAGPSGQAARIAKDAGKFNAAMPKAWSRKSGPRFSEKDHAQANAGAGSQFVVQLPALWPDIHGCAASHVPMEHDFRRELR